MINQSNEDVIRHIKTHTERSVDDRSAVAVLNIFLRLEGRINASFSTDDKWPNHDGTFEFVSNPNISRSPKKTFYVQIKGTRNYSEKDGVVKYCLKDLAFPAFICEGVSFDPGILFVVLNPNDRGHERVFWKYMSVDFVNSIDFSKNSVIIDFETKNEILNSDESMMSFCNQLEIIIEQHSFVNQLSKKTYSEDQVEKIIKRCNEEITDSIDQLEIINTNGDNISKNILIRLDDLCASALLLNAMKDGYQQPSIAMAWEHSLLNIESKYLSDFYRGLQYIGKQIPDDGQSERLMLKYYNFMWQIRNFLQKTYDIKIFSNLEKITDYIGLDDLDKEYYKLVANAFNNIKQEVPICSATRFYVQKKTPFYVGTERYYEVILQQASIYASKYNRITAYTQKDISTGYSIKIDYVNSIINLWGIDTEIKIIKNWKVSIDPKCLNKLGKVLKVPLRLSSNYNEYDELMIFFSKTGMNLLELIDLCDVNFSKVLENIYQNTNTSNFKNILQILRDNYSKDHNTIIGRYTIRYLLLNMREEIFDRIMPSYLNPRCISNNLYLSKDCYSFEQNPLIINLVGSKTCSVNQMKYLANIVEKEKIEAVIPYWTIMKHIQETGEIYCDINSILTESSIKKYNSSLDYWERKNGFKIIIEENLAYIDSYENVTLSILKKLLELSQFYKESQKEFNKNYLNQNEIDILDLNKKEALKNAFVNSRVLLIYGAAGTGKTTLIDMISTMMSCQKKLFLTKTHASLQNLKRKIKNPGLNSDFAVIDSLRKKTCRDYDIVFIDECSVIDNRIMNDFLEKIHSNTLLVLAGDVYQIESIEFGNWFLYAKEIIKSQGSNVELLSTWRTDDQKLIELWEEVRNNGNLITEKLVIDGPFSENIGKNIFNKEKEDEVVLCLNYDGKFGLNNINIYMQNANSNESVTWGEWKYKVDDPILFNDTKRFNFLYNNLKGKIVNIIKLTDRIRFTVDVAITLTEEKCQNDGIEFIEKNEFGTRIRFEVLEYNEEMSEEDCKKTIVPFQLAYAVSIHKAQGLEYESVKVVIPNNNAEKITHGIFYTAITRAKENLRIYWSPETMQKIVKEFSLDNSKKISLDIIKNKLSEM